MIGQAWRDALKQKQGEQVYLDALQDYVSGELGAAPHSVTVARILSVLILMTPFLVGLLGVSLILSTLPSLGGVVFGGLFLTAAYFLCPRRYRLPPDALTQSDAPVFFAQLDAVSEVLDAPKITHITVTDEFNASVTKEGKQCVLGIGALLWEAATDAERLALVAHEIAHLVNNDPARAKLVRYALDSLARWEQMVAPEVGGPGNVFAEVVQLPLHLLIVGLEKALLRPLFLQSQRAEYLADGFAAKVAGSDAVVSLLETLSLQDNLQQDWKTRYGLGGATGRDVIKRLSSAISDIDPQKRAALLAQVDHQKLSVDVTHPPSAYRIAFVKTIAIDEGRLLPCVFRKEDPELVRRLDRLGEKMAVHFDVQ